MISKIKTKHVSKIKPKYSTRVLKRLRRKGPQFFNELVRGLEGHVSRKTVYAVLLHADLDKLIESEMIKSKYTDESGVVVYRWLRIFKLTKKGNDYLDEL
jgi:DNA-binding HxlR family transcriptional regulator